MKTRMKRLISLVCVLTVFASTVLSTDFLSAKAETNSGQAETLPTDMTEITFLDFELKGPNYSGVFKDGEYTKWSYAKYAGETMDNTLFSGTITFPQVADAFFMYAGNAIAEGIQLVTAQEKTGEWYLRLRNSETKKDLKKITAKEAGVDSLVDVPLELHISLEYIDNDNGGTENDVKLGVWFGDTLYMNEYTYINDCVGSEKIIGPYLAFQPPKTAGITMKSYTTPLPTDMTEITFMDFGIRDDKYKSTFASTYAGATMDNTLFSGKITFSETGSTNLVYGGTCAGGGFILQDTVDWKGDPCLRLWDSNYENKKFEDQRFYADKAGVDTFEGKEIELNYTIEYVNNDNGTTKNDLKLGVWFNKRLYENKYIYINDYVDNGHSLGNYMTVWPQNGAEVELKSCNYQLPDDMTELSFRDFTLKGPNYSGTFKDAEYTKWSYATYAGETMDNTLFGGTITFPKEANVFFMYAGNAIGEGIQLVTAQETTGEWYLRLRNSETKKDLKKLTAQDADVEALVGVPLELHISLEYIDNDNGGTKNDVKLGVWFGGNLYMDEYIYIDNCVGSTKIIGPYLTFQPKTTAGITMKSSDIKLPKGMTEISFRDFGFDDGNVSGSFSGEYDGDTLDGTMFSGKITLPEPTLGTDAAGKTVAQKTVHLGYGGKVAGGGIELATGYDATKGEFCLRLRNPIGGAENPYTFGESKLYSDTAEVNLFNEEFDLNISLEYIDKDNGGRKNDVKLGVWFNGKLYNNEYKYIYNFVDNNHSMGTWMKLNQLGGASTKVESVAEFDRKTLPEGMTEISFWDFGFTEKVPKGYGEYDGDTLNNTLLSGKITLPEPILGTDDEGKTETKGSVHLIYGGKEAGGGIELATGYDSARGEFCLRLRDPKNKKDLVTFDEIKFYQGTAEATFFGEELDLNISLEYIDRDGGGTENDVKLGIWFNGKLYSNRYIYLYNYVDNNTCMGTWMSFATYNGAKVQIESVGERDWKTLPEGMTEISFRDFEFRDGKVTKNPPYGEYEGDTLNNTLFSGKITFPTPTLDTNDKGETETKGSVHLIYGGKEAGGGIELATGYDSAKDEFCLRIRDPKMGKDLVTFDEIRLYADVAEVELFEKEFDLSITLQYIDRDGDGTENDVKLGIWFNGKLYNNRYIYLYDYVDNNTCMGTWMNIARTNGAITSIKSTGAVRWKPLPTGMTEIGFSDFSIKPGVYEGVATGTYEGESLNNTLFSGIVKWHPEVGATHLVYGGVGGSHGALNLVNDLDAKTGELCLRMFYTTPTKDGKKTYTNYYFYSDVADVTLIGEELDLKISLEYVDNDGGAKNNDLQIGLWFGGKLYNNRYIYIDNFQETGHVLSNKIQIVNGSGSVFSVGRVSEWLNWKTFGLTANWKKTLLDTDFNLNYALAGGNPNTGDNTTFPYSLMSATLAVIVLCGCQIIRKEREEHAEC